MKTVALSLLISFGLIPAMTVAQSVVITKKMSDADAKELLTAIKELDPKSYSLSLETKDGKRATFGSVKLGSVKAGSSLVNVNAGSKVAIVHSTVTDFFSRTVRPKDFETLATIKRITQKYQ